MTRTVQFTTDDGVTLVGDVDLATDARGAAVVCHPHPQFGGNRFNAVVQAIFETIPAAGFTALRFDFRPDFDHGRGEVLDATAAIDHLATTVGDVPLFVVGYSFGAAVGLAVDHPRVAGKVLVAPPLAMGSVNGAFERAMDAPTLVLTPAHDQFSPPDATEAIVATWPATTFETIASADHFLAGRTSAVAQRTVEFLDDLV